ncbi:hypothetical protein ACHAWF_007780 [Thalassiosira exigua]
MSEDPSLHHTDHAAGLLHVPALPEPVKEEHEDEEEDEEGAYHIPGAETADVVVVDATKPYNEEEEAAAAAAVAAAEAEEGTPGKARRQMKERVKKVPLTPHEALHFAGRGVYVDVDTGRLKCSCNHKPCDRWDQYGYTRHFAFKCHRRYEAERLDDHELHRLREAKNTFLRMNPLVEESTIRRKRKLGEGEKLLSVEELRVQEKHWMEMWKEAKNELRQLRQDLKQEDDPEVRAELMSDIEGLKRRKGDWGKLLGFDDPVPAPVNF